jgi:abortive phage resistance protein AbiGi (putative antitoxin)
MFTRLRRWLADRLAPEHEQRYVGRDLSHFVGRDRPPEEQYQILSQILTSGWLLGSPPQEKNSTGHIRIDSSKSFSLNEMLVPQMLCFCDIPLTELTIHCHKYGRFGLAFSKRFLADRGARPVIYVPADGKTLAAYSVNPQSGLNFAHRHGAESLGNWAPTGRHFDEFIPQLRRTLDRAGEAPTSSLSNFLHRDILSFYKFFDLAQAEQHPDNYYFEREWRILGNVKFGAQDVTRVFMPSEYVERFSKEKTNAFIPLIHRLK